ncbi:MAG: gamma-glutamylcyclotransferase [Terracidiphilus sp.]|nr:gamma-glutamylcyclotransferase [Terracidiphilus sp.]
MSAQLFQIEATGKVALDNLFFAYGANMNLAHLRQRCSHPVRVAVACLQNYRIGFYGHSEIWDGAMETAIEAEGSQLWGVLYALSGSDWDQIDQWQDARFDGAGRYFHYPIQAMDAHGKRYDARLYKKDVLYAPQLPSNSYMELILDGARQNQLPPAYIDSLSAIPTIPAHYAVPMRSGYTPSATASCASCDSTS